MDGHSIAWRNFGVHGAAEPQPLAPPTMPGLLIVGAMGSLIVATLVCCLLTVRVAADRRMAAQLDRDIARGAREIVVLHKELAVRARFEELDRWNAVLGLAPPRARQYLLSAADLSAFAPQRVQIAYHAAPARRPRRVA